MEPKNRYYFIFKNLSLDENQWSYFIDSVGVVISFLGILYALHLYKKQRKDSAKEAYIYFQDSLSDLKRGIETTIEGLDAFIKSLDKEHFSAPYISTSLNDNFTQRINLVDLSRYYRQNKLNEHSDLRKFLSFADYIGSYQVSFTDRLNYLQNFYLTKEPVYQQWQSLRTLNHFHDENQTEFTKVYGKWITEMLNDSEVFSYQSESHTSVLLSRKLLIKKHISNIAINSYKYVLENNDIAVEVHKIANQVVSAFLDIEEFHNKLGIAFTDDLEKFVIIKENLVKLMDKADA